MAELVKKKRRLPEGEEEKSSSKSAAPSFLYKLYDILEVLPV